jgi:hypothetical protein
MEDNAGHGGIIEPSEDPDRQGSPWRHEYVARLPEAA